MKTFSRYKKYKLILKAAICLAILNMILWIGFSSYQYIGGLFGFMAGWLLAELKHFPKEIVSQYELTEDEKQWLADWDEIGKNK